MDNNIVTEAIQKLEKEPINLAKLKSKILDRENNIIYEDAGIDLFKNYYNLLKMNILEDDFDPKLNYKPEYASYFHYSTASYDYLILHANDMISKKQFKRENFPSGKYKYYDRNIIDIISKEYASKGVTNVEDTIIENFLLFKI